jgi:fructokinase
MSGKLILCCGEALIDMIPQAKDGGQGAFVPLPGGAVFNTAIALGRLGCEVGLLSGLSRDMFGTILSESLKSSHVRTDLAIFSDRPTTLAFITLRDGQAQYSFYDEGSAGRMIAAHDLPQLPGDLSALYFGGISLACEPCAETYAHLLERAAEQSVVMIDPNIRPGFIADAGRYRLRLQRMMRRADIVKISDEDLEWLHPQPEPLDAKIGRIRELGPSIVILTRGAAGAMAWTVDGSSVSVGARSVKVVDTVGAGDTFNAGTLAALQFGGLLSRERLRSIDKDAMAAALTLGVDVAAVTVSRAGANPPWRHELNGALIVECR